MTYPHELRIMVLNAQDLFLFMDKYDGTPIEKMNEIKWALMSSSLFNNKSKEKCLSLAHTIKKSQIDIVMMTEIGGEESLKNFAEFVLQNEYKYYTLPSNSDRGIDLGYLIKAHLVQDFEVKLQSYKDFSLPAPAHKFSRDVLRLDLKKEGKPFLIFLLAHIKSKLDLKKADFEGRTRRSLEMKGLIKIYKSLEQFGVPILIGGDFNGQAGEKDTEEEFKIIYKETDLMDIAYLAQIPDVDRFSYIYFNRGGNRFIQQIDYLFISKKYASLIDPTECYFPRYQRLEGQPLPIPARMEQKSLLPSDHYPFVATLKFSP